MKTAWILLSLILVGCQNPAIEREEREWQESFNQRRQEYIASHSWTEEQTWRIEGRWPWMGISLEAFRALFGSEGSSSGEDVLGTWNLIYWEGGDYFFRNGELVSISNY